MELEPTISMNDEPEINAHALDGTVFISDNLPFLKSLDNESIDLVCIDPPFGKKQTFTGNIKPPLTEIERVAEADLMESWSVFDEASAYERGLEYPDTSGTTANFKDIWSFGAWVEKGASERIALQCPGVALLIKATRRTHSDSIAAYIAFMAERMLEVRRILKPTGSVYLHCDHEANAYLRQMMDAIFGWDKFQNEIVWAYGLGGSSPRRWSRKHDTILFYSKSTRPMFNKPTEPATSARMLGQMKGMSDVWDDIPSLNNMARERSGYPTQKPIALAKRIIEAGTDPGDLVLDCFAGCAYVPVAAQLTGRRWIACDMSPRAWTVVRRQFHKHPELGIVTEGEIATDDTDGGKIEQKLENGRRVIKVRGPGQLPIRTTADDPVPTVVEPLPEIRYRQSPVESGDQIWSAFIAQWGPRCWYCGTEKVEDRRELHLDHIEPNRRDGTNDDCWNRAIACTICNSNKSDRLTPDETTRKARETGLIRTDALMDEVLDQFNRRREWARLRWECDIKPNGSR